MNSFRHRMRVRYQETDGQGHVHHANYLTYFEQARVEMLRDIGQDYREVEKQGAILVVTEMDIRYHAPAYFDDLLVIEIRLIRAKGARMEHEYEVFREGTTGTGTTGTGPIVTGRSVVACLNEKGKPCRLPPSLQVDID
jgi:acyl-CoA thioester hydrolase